MADSEGASAVWRRALVVAMRLSGIHTLVVRILQQSAFRPHVAETYTEAVVSLEHRMPDVVVVWVEEPEVVQAFVLQARALAQSPILGIGPALSDASIASLFAAGLDDYVSIPIGPLEFAARVQSAVRRGAHLAETEQTVAFGGFLLDTNSRAVRANGSSIRLSPNEFRLMFALAQEPGRVIDHDTLVERVWGSRYLADHTALRTVVRRLRFRLREFIDTQHELIKTIHGVGYYLDERVCSAEQLTSETRG